MGAYKNIFGAFTNVFDKTKKGVKAIVKRSPTKSLSSPVISTTSKTIGSSAPIISGGRTVAKKSASRFAKGVGSTANVGGKVFGATAILGGVSIAGAKIYDYVGDKWAVTTAQREYENQIKLAGDEADVIKKAQDQQIDYMNKIIDMRNAGNDPASLGASGGAGGLFPMGEDVVGAQGSKNIMWYALLGIAAIGGTAYIYKNYKGGKK